jgi:hypothetical protein
MENWRPRGEVTTITMHNTHNKEADWILTRYERRLWVRLNPRRLEDWAREACRNAGDNMRGSFKAQIVDFCFKVDKCKLVTNKPK